MSWSNGINLQRLIPAARTGGNRGLRDAAEHVLGVSDSRVPIEESTLSRSGKVSTDEAALRAAVSYDTEYAVVQHEDPTLRHDAGRSAKYLESSLTGERATVGRIVQTAVRRELGT